METIKFEDLTQEQKDRLLKTLIVIASGPEEGKLELLDSYIKYGAESFDGSITIAFDGSVLEFTKKVA